MYTTAASACATAAAARTESVGRRSLSQVCLDHLLELIELKHAVAIGVRVAHHRLDLLRRKGHAQFCCHGLDLSGVHRARAVRVKFIKDGAQLCLKLRALHAQLRRPSRGHWRWGRGSLSHAALRKNIRGSTFSKFAKRRNRNLENAAYAIVPSHRSFSCCACMLL